MKYKSSKIFLPGGISLYEFLIKHYKIAGTNILILGYGAEAVADRMLADGAASAEIAVPSGELLLQSRMNLKNPGVEVRFMEYHQLAQKDSSFDLVYAQGSLAAKERNLVSTQIYRVLRPKGYFCLGETVALSAAPPLFIRNIWENSGMSVLTRDALLDYYRERGFVIDTIKNLSGTLRPFYLDSRDELEARLSAMSTDEKKELKKLIPRLTHEINAYLKQGGDRHMGFIAHLFHK